jgi:hypothetical protein
VRGGVDGFPRLLPGHGTRVAFEPLSCKRPQQPSIRRHHHSCTVRPRQPQLSDLYQLLETHYDDVKAQWEDRFEKAYGYWRGFIDNVVLRYLDCGVAEGGFARIVCEDCRSEFLLCFSCKSRNLCPSCHAKRAAAFAAFLQEELLEDVGHAVWSFSIPKMLRRYFLFRRELLTELARAAYETVEVRKKSDRSVGRERSGESCGDSRRNEWSRGRAKICARVVADVGGVECRARERNGAGSRPGW